MKPLFLLLLFVSCFIGLHAQETFPTYGPKPKNDNYYCFFNAVIHFNPDETIEKGSLVIRNGRIVEVSTKNVSPKGAIAIDLQGKHIYPSFIDVYSSYGFDQAKKGATGRSNSGPQYESSSKTAGYWNESIHPETRAAELFEPEAKSATEMRNIGFGALLTHPNDGIIRGTSALVALGEERSNIMLIKSDVALQYAFKKGSSRQAYPSSLMGSIALIKQVFYDAHWYALQNTLKEENLALAAMNRWKHLPQIMDAGDKYNILRAHKIANEFNLQFIYKGDGKEYQRWKEIAAIKSTLIVPLNFPDAYDVDELYSAMMVSLEDMKHWEMAPYNCALLFQNKIDFVITASDLKNKKQFLSQLRLAVKNGLPENEALRALTIKPAKLISADHEIGTLETGKWANFFITTESIFSDKALITQNWVRGTKYVVKADDPIDVRGEYDLNVLNTIYPLSVKGEDSKLMATVKVDTNKIKVKIDVEKNNISLAFDPNDKNYKGIILLSGNINFNSGSWDGNGQLPDGTWIKWNAIRKSPFKEIAKEKPKSKDSLSLGKTWFPNMAYGWDSIPNPTAILIKNATVWTNESEGILKNTDVLIRDGKIVKVGKILDVVDGKTWVIDGTNKHVTSGIIDEHSHIAISGGVNEGSHAVTAEVSIADVVDADDINIYRQLAGGVTAAQLLHGSANPIGGRSALIKLRWGKSPEEMKIDNADGFIKFALGENVKQSNWGERYSVRYPQTRMGVEQVFYDAFYRAKAYETEWKNYEKLIAKKPKISPQAPRKDLQLEVLVEILNSKRFITCHSYVQSEINMLMHVADSMGFKINTFTHILEGYKVADKMKQHGVNASTFSDWWAYKYEVIEAIPYNATILAAVGVTTAINSDDAEMARRLNQEAAKSVKYGGMSQEEAWKLVTLNPAKMLHLDHRMGSIKKDKDADVVIWSDNPLSVYAKVEKTIIDGLCYYDAQRDVLLRERNQEERLRLINKMIAAKQNGAATQPASMKSQLLYHCDTEIDYTLENK